MPQPKQVYTTIFDYANKLMQQRHMNSTEDFYVMLEQFRQYAADVDVDDKSLLAFTEELKSLQDHIKDNNGYKEVSFLFNNGDIVTVSCNLLIERGEITLAQVVEELSDADVLCADGHFLYGVFEEDPTAIRFSYDSGGLTYGIEINEDNFVSAEFLSPTEIKVKYNVLFFVVISKLKEVEFKLN